MFQIKSVDGELIAFAPGQLQAKRIEKNVTEVQAIKSVSPKESKSSEYQEVKKALVAHYNQEIKPVEKSEVRFISEIMSCPVFTLQETSTIKEAQDIFAAKRFRHIPVVSTSAALTGIISDRNLLNYAASNKNRNINDDKTTISEIMTKDVLIASPDDLIREAAQIMIEERIGALPIINTQAYLVGILTRSDILRALIIHGPLKIWA